MNADAIAPEVVAKHVAALLGLNVSAKKVGPSDLKGQLVLGIVDDEAGQLVCLVQFEFAAAAATGAALSRIPAGAVQDAVRQGAMDESLLGNFQEIINVLTVLTTNALGQRTKLREVKQGKDAADPALRAFTTKAKTKVCGQLNVQGYPSGCFAFLFA